MKYKTLIEKNSEPILTEGRLSPPSPPALTAPLSSPRFPLPPTHPTKGAFTLAKKIAGSLKKTHAPRIQLKHVVPKHVNERAVVLLLLVLFQL